MLCGGDCKGGVGKTDLKQSQRSAVQWLVCDKDRRGNGWM